MSPMRRLVQFTVEGRPVAKGRPRFGQGHTFTPERTRSAEETVGWAARQACPEPLDGPVMLRVTYWFKTPKRKFQEMHGTAYAGRPDLDNLLKLTKDACNGILWKDDAQVYAVEATKMYGMYDQTEVEVRTGG